MDVRIKGEGERVRCFINHQVEGSLDICETHTHATHPVYIGCIPEQNLSLFEEIGGTLSLNSIKIQNIQCTLNVKKLDSLTHNKKKNQSVETDPQMVEQAEKDSKTTIINTLHFSRRQRKTCL